MEIADLRNKLAAEQYLCGEELGLVLCLSEKLQKPILLEGPAGVGKTDLARAYARATQRELIRLQCYEGLDEGHALYEWNYQKQLLYLESQKGGAWRETKKDIFSEEFLLPRPLLKAFLTEQPAVLLIDEIDKSDEAFESFLLEALSDFAVTIPEWGTVTAKTIPMVFLTSNGARDFSDGLKRRCVHYYIDYPTAEAEYHIIKAKLPLLSDDLAREITAFVHHLRQKKGHRCPGIAEVLDWAEVLYTLNMTSLDDPGIGDTYHFLVKSREAFLSLTKEKQKDRL